MPKLARAFQKIFASGITPTGNVAVFGSLAVGAPAYSSDPEVIQSLTPWSLGWGSATIGNQSPAYQDFNGYQYVVTRQLAYLFQQGVSEWNSQTSYYVGSFVQVAGVMYRSITNDNLNNAVTDPANWAPFLNYNDLVNRPDSRSACKAWVNFRGDGGTGAQTINSQFNVSSVSRLATGSYVVNFSPALANANYCVVGTGIAPSNGAASIGEATSGSSYVLKTTTQLQIKVDGSGGPTNLFSGSICIYST